VRWTHAGQSKASASQARASRRSPDKLDPGALEFQRDWTRHETYQAARAIVVANGGGYGMGLAYAREDD